MGKWMCRRYFPLVATLFIYILFCNYTGILPFAGDVYGYAAPTSDINFPCGLAVMSRHTLPVFHLKISWKR